MILPAMTTISPFCRVIAWGAEFLEELRMRKMQGVMRGASMRKKKNEITS
jgi:hypothetical protein